MTQPPDKIWCVCLQQEKNDNEVDEVTKQKIEVFTYKCMASVGTPPWKIEVIKIKDGKQETISMENNQPAENAKSTVNTYCKTASFDGCPRLKKFIEYTQAANTLNVKPQQ